MRLIPTTSRMAAAVLAPLVGVLLLPGCGDDDRAAASGETGTVDVVAGFYPLAEVAARVGGDRVQVRDLTPPGAEAHDLELRPDDVEAIEDAALVVMLGQGFQPAVERVAERRDGPTLELLDELPLPDADGGVDPHVWLDPTLMVAVVEEVTAALSEVDPEGADDFRTRADALVDELEQLDADHAAALDSCERSTIVVAHEAFGWLAERYGLDQEGIAGLSPEAEPSPARLAELADLVEAEGVTTVFTESLASPRVAEALAREAGVTTAVLDPLESLSEEQQAAGATYDSVMRENLATLQAALDCR